MNSPLNKWIKWFGAGAIALIVIAVARLGMNDSAAADSGDLSDVQCPYAQIDYIGGMAHTSVFGHTNMVAYRPLITQAYLAKLFDADGGEVRKTAYGRGFGLPLRPDKSLRDGSWSHSILAGYGHSRVIDFNGCRGTDQWVMDISKSFQVKEPGKYRLWVQMRLFTKDTNGVFCPYVLPPSETNIVIYAEDLHRSYPLVVPY